MGVNPIGLQSPYCKRKQIRAGIDMDREGGSRRQGPGIIPTSFGAVYARAPEIRSFTARRGVGSQREEQLRIQKREVRVQC